MAVVVATMAKEPREIILAKVSKAKTFRYRETIDYKGSYYEVVAIDVHQDIYRLYHTKGQPFTRLISKHICGTEGIIYNYYEEYFLGIKLRTTPLNTVKDKWDVTLYDAQIFAK